MEPCQKQPGRGGVVGHDNSHRQLCDIDEVVLDDSILHGRRNRGATGARAPVFELTYEVVQRVSSKSVAVPTSLSTLSCHQLIKISKFYSNNLMLDL